MAKHDPKAESAFSNSTTFAQARAAYELAKSDASEEFLSDAEGDLIYGCLKRSADALLVAPAPDLQSLAYKLEVYRDEEAYSVTGTSEMILTLMIEDVRRLAEEEAQR